VTPSWERKHAQHLGTTSHSNQHQRQHQEPRWRHLSTTAQMIMQLNSLMRKLVIRITNYPDRLGT
jgi:hypothetical protein